MEGGGRSIRQLYFWTVSAALKHVRVYMVNITASACITLLILQRTRDLYASEPTGTY